ncbi:hypothetical protein DL96DRAFT_1812577 [Flagelloscypha sp. PMI_526]|nr:hypothetical protein DL96DRAFT_1812577 [Flagelloscypha sp. PMI_526]
MVPLLAPLFDRNRKTRSSSPLQKKALFTLLFCGIIAIFLVASFPVSTLETQISFGNLGFQHNLEEQPRITNNNVSYPRLHDSSHTQTTITQHEAQIFYDQMRTLSENKTIFHYEDDFVERNNWKEMDRLLKFFSVAKEQATSIKPKVILAPWHWMPCSWNPDCTPGEAVWMKSLLEIMKQHDIFLFYANWSTFRRDWTLLGNNLVTHVWAGDNQVLWCFNDREGCIQSPVNPHGVPPHKLFAFTFWGAPPGRDSWGMSPTRPWKFNPLGSEWSLVPYEMPEGHFHLGYHYQRCSSLPIVPTQHRKDRIVVLSKKSHYFYEWPVFDPKTFFTELRRKTGMDLVTTAELTNGYPIPPGLTSLGEIPAEDYDLLLSESKAVLGIGRPILSPTPYASMCRGVPVIMPYVSRQDDGRTCTAAPSPSDWCGFDIMFHQHGPAGRVGEPYVYMVDALGANATAIDTILRAVSTPIGQYMPPEMMYGAVEQRLLDFFSIDWEAYASEKQSSGLAPETLEIENWQHTWIQGNRDSERPDLD